MIVSNPAPLARPPLDVLQGASLFLDFDGTLVELADHPDGVIVDPTLPDLLASLSQKHQGRVAILSGRSVAQLDRFLGPMAAELPLAGSHGFERRWRDRFDPPVRPTELDNAAEQFSAFAASHPGLIVETKSYGVALHYRCLPALEHDARAVAKRLSSETGLHLQEGKMLFELRAAGSDKGDAIRQFMTLPPMAGTRPIVLGDDITDECAFAVARELGGAGVLVGPLRQTAALYALEGPEVVRDWLRADLA